MNIRYYKTDLGIIIKDNDSIRLKSSYKKTIISNEYFEKSNPIEIRKKDYFILLNDFFNKDNIEWTFNGCTYKKMDNFKDKTEFIKLRNHNEVKQIYGHDCKIVLHKGKLYYTFIAGNYYPRMQLIDFNTKQLTGKWTDIRNLAPVYNKTSKMTI